jgi:putative phosphoesterase
VLIGVISDTHGLLRTEAVEALQRSDLILHAGDIGPAAILDELKNIAPVKAIRGNVDIDAWARRLPATRTVMAGDLQIYLIHDVKQLGPTPDVHAVVSGHSHKPTVVWRDGVLFLNPGSAGRRRFKLPVTIARIRVSGRTLEPEIVTLCD